MVETLKRTYKAKVLCLTQRKRPAVRDFIPKSAEFHLGCPLTALAGVGGDYYRHSVSAEEQTS